MDVEVRFGEPVAFSASSNRKQTARLMEERVSALFQAAMREPRPSGTGATGKPAA
jgi:1-acyl-sn-glycerol-3-phosphate acyltransferase